MRALQFTKIDYIKTKQQAILFPSFWLIAAIYASGAAGERPFSLVTGFVYLMFITVVFSTTPFGACTKKDAGFLVLLPSTVADRVVGRFLFAVSLLVSSLAVIGIMGLACRFAGVSISGWTLPFCLVIFAVSVLTIAIEFDFFYLFGENKSAQILSLVRMIPGMAMFFAMNSVMNNFVREKPDGIAAYMTEALMNMSPAKMQAAGWACVAIAAAVFIGSILLCIKVTAKRDYS